MAITLEPGDVFLTRGTNLLSRAIRFFTRTLGESRTRVNHVGVVVTSGDFKTCSVVEALIKVREHSLWSQYGPPKKDSVAVFRPLNLTDEEVVTIVAEAREQVGKRYGYFKILGHFLDWCLQGVYFFRWFFRNGQYPICSWLVAHAFAKVGKDFGVKAGAIDPDQIWDFVTDENNEDKHEQIHPLKSIWDSTEPDAEMKTAPAPPNGESNSERLKAHRLSDSAESED
jgi:hypothetical protein